MKNLANCGPREFLRQTNKIRHAVEKWLTLTDIMNIRKRLPELPKDAPEAEKNKLLEAQARENIRAMLDAVMEQHPDETADLLALCCFVEPEESDNYPMSAYLGALDDMIENEDVTRFFTSLMKLARKSGLLD